MKTTSRRDTHELRRSQARAKCPRHAPLFSTMPAAHSLAVAREIHDRHPAPRTEDGAGMKLFPVALFSLAMLPLGSLDAGTSALFRAGLNRRMAKSYDPRPHRLLDHQPVPHTAKALLAPVTKDMTLGFGTSGCEAVVSSSRRWLRCHDLLTMDFENALKHIDWSCFVRKPISRAPICPVVRPVLRERQLRLLAATREAPPPVSFQCLPTDGSGAAYAGIFWMCLKH